MHEGMRTLLGAVNIKLLFEERIDSGIECKWESRWAAYSETAIEVEAEWTVQEEVDLGTTHLEWLGA